MSIQTKVQVYLNNLSSQELVDFYNKHTGSKITKFESKMKGVLQTLRALEKAGKLDDIATMINMEPKKPAEQSDETKEVEMAKEKVKAKVAPKKEVAAKKVAAAKKDELDRSSAIKASWGDKSVRAARSARHRVKVDGVEYPSVMKSLVALKLAPQLCNGIRTKLVADGKAEAEGKKFVLVKD